MDPIALLFTLLNIFFALFILFLTLAFVTGAPFVKSNKRAVNAMIQLAAIKPGTRVYDLGSGDGTFLFRAAALGATAIGYEINPFLVLWTNMRKMLSPQRNHVFALWRNFWTADFSGADVIFVYLLPWRMEALENLLKTKCKPSTRIVSNSFIFPSLKRIKEDSAAHVYSFQI